MTCGRANKQRGRNHENQAYLYVQVHTYLLIRIAFGLREFFSKLPIWKHNERFELPALPLPPAPPGREFKPHVRIASCRKKPLNRLARSPESLNPQEINPSRTAMPFWRRWHAAEAKSLITPPPRIARARWIAWSDWVSA